MEKRRVPSSHAGQHVSTVIIDGLIKAVDENGEPLWPYPAPTSGSTHDQED